MEIKTTICQYCGMKIKQNPTHIKAHLLWHYQQENPKTIQIKAECHAPQEICTHKWMNGCITRYWICEHLTIKREDKPCH